MRRLLGGVSLLRRRGFPIASQQDKHLHQGIAWSLRWMSSPVASALEGNSEVPELKGEVIITQKLRWSEEERDILRSIMATARQQSKGKLEWNSIVSQFNEERLEAGLQGPPRSKSSVTHQYKKRIACTAKKGAFTEAEISILKEAIEEHDAAGTPQADPVWTEIMRRLPGRTKDQIHAWHVSYFWPERQEGEWTDEEKVAIAKAIPACSELIKSGSKELYRTSWTKVAAAVKTRTAKQCSLYYKRRMQSREMGQWTDDGDNTLFEQMYHLYRDGYDVSWSRVSKALRTNGYPRSDMQCRDRWQTYQRMLGNVSGRPGSPRDRWGEADMRMLEAALLETKDLNLGLYDQIEHVVQHVRQTREDESLNSERSNQPLICYRIKALEILDPETYRVLFTPS